MEKDGLTRKNASVRGNLEKQTETDATTARLVLAIHYLLDAAGIRQPKLD